jgi:hypothetical protein
MFVSLSAAPIASIVSAAAVTRGNPICAAIERIGPITCTPVISRANRVIIARNPRTAIARSGVCGGVIHVSHRRRGQISIPIAVRRSTETNADEHSRTSKNVATCQ